VYAAREIQLNQYFSVLAAQPARALHPPALIFVLM